MEITLTIAAALALTTAIVAIAKSWGNSTAHAENLKASHEHLAKHVDQNHRETLRKLHQVAAAHANLQMRIAVLEERAPGVPRRIPVDVTPIPFDPEDSG